MLAFAKCESQTLLPLDFLKIKSATDLYADDYGNVYLKSADFSFSKYDSLGFLTGRQQLSAPIKILEIQNPLNINGFSENTQEIKFFDQNLNEINTLKLGGKFVFISNIDPVTQQYIWLFDDSTKNLINYNFQNNTALQSFAFREGLNALDILVYRDFVFVVRTSEFLVMKVDGTKVFSATINNGKRLRREGNDIYIIAKNEIYCFADGRWRVDFSVPNASFVDKNKEAYFVVENNKLYLYRIKMNPSQIR